MVQSCVTIVDTAGKRGQMSNEGEKLPEAAPATSAAHREGTEEFPRDVSNEGGPLIGAAPCGTAG